VAGRTLKILIYSYVKGCLEIQMSCEKDVYTGTSLENLVMVDEDTLVRRIEVALNRVINKEFHKVNYDLHVSVLIALGAVNAVLGVLILVFK
jgi:hypothetical protein